MNQETRQPGELQSQPPPIPSTTPEIDGATLQLLNSWRAEDATDDANEIRAAERELAEFKEAMNKIRIQAGELPLYL
jgi:hypothetical protein